MIIEKTGLISLSKSLCMGGIVQILLGILALLCLSLLFVKGEFDNLNYPFLFLFMTIFPSIFLFANGVASVYSDKKSKKINYKEGKKSTVYLVDMYGGLGQQSYIGFEKEWFCPYCGTSIGSQTSKFCPECGKSLLSTEPESENDSC